MAYHHAPAAMPGSALGAPKVSSAYAWLVFALTFGLLLSDYMSRQVLNAVFPILKAEWTLTDTQLGSLSSIVALLVGLLTFPLSLAADRWGRIKSIVLMAGLWSLATLGCALASGYGEMLTARFFVGLGEAAYGSVGIALIISIFPPHLRSTLAGAFMAGGPIGSVLGMALGGIVAVKFGWRWSFGVMAVFGLVLVIFYWLVVTERRLASRPTDSDATKHLANSPKQDRVPLSGLFSSTSVVCAYVGSGLQLFIMAAVMAWLPSFMNRYYAMAPDKAGMAAAVFILIGGVGMVLCGIITDRLSRNVPGRKWLIAITYSLLSAILLLIAFRLETGTPQLVLIGAGMLIVAGTTGPVGAMVANLTHPSIHSTAFATLTLANNLLGLAPGPFLTGMLADRLELLGAMQVIPFIAVAAAVVFAIGQRYYAGDLARLASASRQS